MAKIKGIEIKNIKKFMGHDGECYQGNIYLDSKKIGFWSQDAWNGSDSFDFDNQELENTFIQRVKSCFDENPEKDYHHLTMAEFVAGKQPELKHYDALLIPHDIFMNKLLHLVLDEKLYKKKVKAGYNVLVMYDYHHIKAPIPCSSYVCYPPNFTMDNIGGHYGKH